MDIAYYLFLYILYSLLWDIHTVVTTEFDGNPE